MDLSIRCEERADRAAVYELTRAAFAGDAEAQLVEALRDSSAFLPELSLVAVHDEVIVGHVLFTRVVVKGEQARHPALALAPLAVRPSMQGKGVGTALVEHGLAAAREGGHGIVIVLGHPGYYPRFGFVPAQAFSIGSPFDAPEEAFLVLGLQPHSLRGVHGLVEYPLEFGAPG